MNWIQTYTGKRFDVTNPAPEDFDILDIAHSLSLQCRYGGHCARFYSVAEHCVLLSRHLVVRAELAYAALMHDAAEAYLVDVPRPIKKMLPSYREIEYRVEGALFDKFGVLRSDVDAIMVYDRAILMDERAQLFADQLPWDVEMPPLGIKLEFWEPAVAKRMFLIEYNKLQAIRKI